MPGLVCRLLRVLPGEHGGCDEGAGGLRCPPLPGPGAAPPSPCPAQLLLVTPTHRPHHLSWWPHHLLASLWYKCLVPRARSSPQAVWVGS